MAMFEWNSSLELGIPVVVGQHKALFGWVDALNDSVRASEKEHKWQYVLPGKTSMMSQLNLSPQL